MAVQSTIRLQQGYLLKIQQNTDGTWSPVVRIGGGTVSDQAMEWEGYRLQLHNNGDGTFSPLVTTTTGATDQVYEYQGYNIKLHPTGQNDPVSGSPMYAIVVVQI